VFFSFALVAAEALGGGHQLRVLGHEDRAEEVGVEVANGAPQPHVEEVGEGGVADVVVVGRVGGDEDVREAVPGARGVEGPGVAPLRHRERIEALGGTVDTRRPPANDITQHVRFCEVPHHGDGLPLEEVPDDLVRVVPSAERVAKIHDTIEVQIQESSHRGGVGVGLGFREPRRQRIPPHVRPHLPHQVRQRHHRRELPGGEVIGQGCQTPQGCLDRDRVVGKWLFRPPRRLRLAGDGLVLVSGGQVDPAPARVGHDGHEARSHSDGLALLLEVVVRDRVAGEETAKQRPAGLRPGLHRRAVGRLAGAHDKAPHARRPVHHRLEPRLAPLLARKPEGTHERHGCPAGGRVRARHRPRPDPGDDRERLPYVGLEVRVLGGHLRRHLHRRVEVADLLARPLEDHPAVVAHVGRQAC
jgi:hypothetical protein